MPDKSGNPNITDYQSVDVPDPKNKPPSQWHYTERRAYLLERIFEAGTPLKLNQSELAKYLDVNDSTVSRDMDKLRETFEQSLGRSARMRTQAAFERIYGDLLECDDWRAKARAWEMLMEWNEWLERRGKQENHAVDKHDVTHREEETETENWVIESSDSTEIDYEPKETPNRGE